MRLLTSGEGAVNRYCALFFRGGAQSPAADEEMQQALLKAKRRIRDLSRDDPVTGLFNETAFRDVLAHDWAVARRERSRLALVSFRVDDFDFYLEVFGRHASHSCLRRVAQAVRRCLRRASDVAARIGTASGEHLVVLSHATDEEGLQVFSTRIAAAVRDLGLHHPRSRHSRFVTVTPHTAVVDVTGEAGDPGTFLDGLLVEP